MSKKLKVLALVLVAILSLSVFAGCKDKETQGSSSAITQSDVQGNTQNGDEQNGDQNGDENTASGTASDEDQNDGPGNGGPGTNNDGPGSVGTTSGGTTSRVKDPNNGKNPTDINVKGFPIVKNPITFKIMGLSSPNRGDPKEMSMFKYIEKLTNIKIEYIGVSESAYNERRTLALQSGDMPDLFTYKDWGDLMLNKYGTGSKPAIVDVSDLLKTYAPTISELMKNPTTKALNTSGDGSVYIIPQRPRTMMDYWHYINVNKVWLDNLGLDIPKTSAEFLDMLKAFRDEDADGDGDLDDEVPFATSNLGGNFTLGFWGVYTTTGMIGIDLNGKVYYPTATKNALAAAKYWYGIRSEEGLMDKTLVNDQTKFLTAVKKGNVGCYVWGNTDSSVIPPNLLKQYVAIPFPTANFTNNEIKVSKSANPFRSIPGRGNWVITSSCKNVPAMLRLLDYLTTYDGIMVGNWGDPNGGNYKKNSDGTYTITNKNLINADTDFKNAMGYHMGMDETHRVMSDKIIRDKKLMNNKEAVSDAYQEAAIKTYKKAHKENPVYLMPSFQKTSEELRQLRVYEGKDFGSSGWMYSYISGYWKIEDWDTRVNNLYKNGLQGYINFYQKFVDRNKASLVNTATYDNEK